MVAVAGMGLLVALLGATLTPAVTGQSLAQPLPLRCQVDGGPWRDCQMRIEELGMLWSLVVGLQQFGFQHDGRGQVRMRRGGGPASPWVPVEARWRADAALCWDGICAKGDFPLD